MTLFFRNGEPCKSTTHLIGRTLKAQHNYACDRCGGVGGSDAWKHTGYTCYKCNGQRILPKTESVYTREKLDALIKLWQIIEYLVLANNMNEEYE